MWFRRLLSDPYNKEKFSAFGYAVIIFSSTYYLADRVWLTPNSFVSKLYQSLASVFGNTTIIVALLGLWCGFIVVWFLDAYKRQLSFIPALIAFAILLRIDLSNLAAQIGENDILWFVISVVVGIRIVGPKLESGLIEGFDSLYTSIIDEYELAPRVTFLSTSGLVTLGILSMFGSESAVQSHLLPVVVGVVLVVFMYKASSYGADLHVIQLGPPRSGKTTMLGGLYVDAEKSEANGPGESVLKKLERELKIEERIPPDRTATNQVVQFSYLSSDEIFRKKITLTSYDHAGELLVGSSESDLLRDKIEEHRNSQNGSSRRKGLIGKSIEIFLQTAMGKKLYWERGLTEAKDANNLTQRRKALAKLVDGADTLLFTIPLEDFLTPVVERGNERTYQSIKTIREIDDEEEIYEERGGESRPIRRIVRRDSKLVYEDKQETQPQPKSRWTSLGDGRFYCSPSPGRDDPEDYRKEYRELVDLFENDSNRSKSFIWVVTMTDLAYDDFKEIYNNTVESLNELPEDTEGDLEDIEGDLYDAHEDYEITFDDKFPHFLTSTDHYTESYGYRLLAEWVQQQYINNEWADFCDPGSNGEDSYMLQESGESLVYPVWINIDAQESEPNDLRIDPKGLGPENYSVPSQILVGSKQVRQRLEGETHEREPEIYDSYLGLEQRVNNLDDDDPVE